MGIIKQKLLEKTNYFLVGLFVLISICFSNAIYADNKQDIVELEAFYHLLFDEKSSAKSPTQSKPRKVRKRKVQESKKPIKETTTKYTAKTISANAPKRISVNSKTSDSSKIFKKTDRSVSKVSTTTISKKSTVEKDPELVAFYESIFGKLKNEQEVKAIPKTYSKENNVAKPIAYKKISEKKDKALIQKRNVDLRKQPAKNVNESASNTNADIEDASENDETKQGTGILDNLRSSQVQKTNKKKNADLFEQAFGKKQQNKAKSLSNKNNLNKTTASSSPTNDMAALFAKAFGGKAAISAPSNVKVDFRVNGSTFGEVELFSNNSGSIDRVDTKSLLELLEEVLKERVFITVQQQLVTKKKTLFNDLNKLGIMTIYNSANLSLDVQIEPNLRKPQILSLLSKQKAFVREENRIEAQKISGFINSYTNVGFNPEGGEAALNMRLEGSLNIGGLVLETTGDYRSQGFDIGQTTLTYDRPERLQRFTLGNISTGSKNFQENLELDGIRISKEFFLDPDLQISPRANEPLQLDTDSEVELYINNQLARRFYLKAGVYALHDIGLYNGANNIRIRIKDEFGKVTVKSSQQYYDSQLLTPGLSLYAISVGYLSNQHNISDSDLEKTPIFSAYYKKGLKKDLTLSLDAQLSSENFLLGAETISSISLGSLQNSVAVSGGKERDTGFATSFEFKPNKKYEQINLDTLREDLLGLDTRSRGFLNSWSITGEYRSEYFSELNATNLDSTATTENIDGISFGNRVFNSNKLKANLQTNFSLNMSEKWQGTLNLGVADYYNADESYYANLSATRRFDNGVRLSIGSRYDTEDEFSMNLQLSIPLSRKKGKKRVDLNVLTDSRDNAYETELSVNPSGLVGKNSLAGSLKHFEGKDSRQQNLDIQYRNNIFESTLSARNSLDKSSNNNSQQLNLGFNTSIACVGGSCAPTYPINDSFAIVSGPSNQTQAIALSNNNQLFRYSDGNDTGLPDNYTALISGKGKKAVVRLDSYRTQNINIDEGTLPNGYDSEKTEFSMLPEYHQGFLLKAGGEPATTLDGMLFDDKNKALGFKGGQWIPVNKGKSVAFFSNKGGRFRVTSIPAGKYKLELFDYPDMEPISINVPDTKGKSHDIGKLVIKTPN